MEKGKKLLNDFIESLKLNEGTVTIEDFYKAVKNAYMDRTTQIYFIWKKIKELYPRIDANRIIREGSWDFGYFQGKQIAEKYGAENIGPMEAVLYQTSKSGWLVFDQEITEFTDEKAVKMFKACPHVEALQRLGASKEEIKEFCRDMIGYCDYGICHAFPNVEIDFPTTVADGEGYGCSMTITRKE